MDADKLVVTVARALARSHGLGDHMTNLDPWMRDAKTAVDAIAASEQAAARRALEMAAEVALDEATCGGAGERLFERVIGEAIRARILAINPSEGTEP